MSTRICTRLAGRTRRLAGVLASALALLAAPAWAGGLDSLAQFVQHTRTGQADFTQAVTAPAKQGQTARTRTQKGRFAFQRPGKFRFDYAQPFEQTIVADGQTLWLHDVDLNQVTARPQAQVLGQTPAAIVAAANDLKALERDFTLTEEPDRDGQQWVKAVPKTRDSQLQSIHVGLRQGPKGPELATLDILDSFGQRSVLSFTGFEVNANVPASQFEFTPPKGADVLRQ
ncbi:MAG: outer membrane lipoprotein chaperone LolA [Pseudomonadota bacterium]|nr:outer membrane lipoprotein chaperone LolA [Pseudomonadota bacterium]